MFELFGNVSFVVMENSALKLHTFKYAEYSFWPII